MTGREGHNLKIAFDSIFIRVGDLCAGFQRVRASSTEVDEGAMTFRNDLAGPDCDLNDLDVLERDAKEGFQRIEQIVLQIPQLTSEEQDALAEAFSELVLQILCCITRKV